MPEGDTIFGLASRLRPLLVGQQVTVARARQPGPAMDRVAGATVTAVASHGKHLLIEFDNGLTLHVHLGMHGACSVLPPERDPATGQATRVVLRAPAATVAFRNSPAVELMRGEALGFHPALRGLGPDLLAPHFDAAPALANLRKAGRSGQPAGEALLDQRVVAGIGNVYRCEVLFTEGVHPRRPLASLDDEALSRLIERARRLLLANRDANLRRTTGPDSTGGRFWVYRRSGRPCLRCGTRITSGRDGGGRVIYWCPACQPLDP